MNMMLDMHIHLMHIHAMTLKEYLSTRPITDAEFGALIGVSQSQVSRIKNGRAAASLKVAVAIEEATGKLVTAKEILLVAEAAE